VGSEMCIRDRKKYNDSDFFSPVLRQYVMHGLCSNYASYVSVMLAVKQERMEEDDNDDNDDDDDDDEEEEEDDWSNPFLNRKATATTASSRRQPHYDTDLASAEALNACLRVLVAKHIDPSLQKSLLRCL